MKVRVLETAYLDNCIRNEGDVFEWDGAGDVLPPCVEPYVEPQEETEPAKGRARKNEQG